MWMKSSCGGTLKSSTFFIMIANRSILLKKKYASPPYPPPEKINVEITLTCLLREPQFVECGGDRYGVPNFEDAV